MTGLPMGRQIHVSLIRRDVLPDLRDDRFSRAQPLPDLFLGRRSPSCSANSTRRVRLTLRFPGAPSRSQGRPGADQVAPGAHRSLRRSAAERSGRRDRVNPRSGPLLVGRSPGSIQGMARGRRPPGLNVRPASPCTANTRRPRVLLVIACAVRAIDLGDECKVASRSQMFCAAGRRPPGSRPARRGCSVQVDGSRKSALGSCELGEPGSQ